MYPYSNMRAHQFRNNSIIDFGVIFSLSTKNNDEIVYTINFDVRVEVLTIFSLGFAEARHKGG